MRILLNILPEEKKMVTERRTRFRFFVWQVFLLFSLELFYLGILSGMYLVLDFERGHQEMLGQDFDRYRDEEKKLKMFEEKFQTTNAMTDAVFSIDRNRFYFTNVFLLLDQYTDEKITFERVSTKEYQVFITGVADTRDDLLAFDEKLKGEKCFSKVNLPLSNLLTQENVNFQMDVMLDEKCMHTTPL
jgi:hypothetical protein